MFIVYNIVTSRIINPLFKEFFTIININIILIKLN